MHKCWHVDITTGLWWWLTWDNRWGSHAKYIKSSHYGLQNKICQAFTLIHNKDKAPLEALEKIFKFKYIDTEYMYNEYKEKP